jgi:hypothetical protein
MIKEFDDLREFFEEHGDAEEGQPGFGLGGIDRSDREDILVAMPELSKNYLSIASRVHLLGFEYGMIALWPQSFGDGSSLGSALIEANSPTYGFYPALKRAGCSVVGFREKDPICCKSDDSVFLAFPTPGEAELHYLAPNFETFLLLLGNLDYFGRRERGNDAVDEFLQIVGKLCGPQSDPIWKDLAEVAYL